MARQGSSLALYFWKIPGARAPNRLPLFRLLILTCLACCLVTTTLSAQSGTESLRNKRKRLQRELRQTQRELELTRAQRGAALGQANLLRVRIEQRQEILETLRQETEFTRRRMQRDSNVVRALNADLDRMRITYGELLRADHRLRLSKGWFVFLLSADGFNQAFRRLAYLRQYRHARRRQHRLIRQTRSDLEARLDRLYFQDLTQDSLVAAAGEQATSLTGELQEQTTLVNQLSSSEKTLLNQVQRQERERAALQASITAIIAKNTAKSRRSGRTATATPDTDSGTGASFGLRRGRLPWPVTGRITRPFGEQPHPEVPSVKIKNTGVDIRADVARSSVATVFAGEVISVRSVPGYGRTVMVRHGGYYTVYAQLASTAVQAGQTVRAGDNLGAVSNGTVHFEIWQGRTPLNPGSWLN